MAKWDVHDIVSTKYLANGWIDFEVHGELDDTGTITLVPYTLNPDEVTSNLLWPMAANILALFLSSDIEPTPWTWQPPDIAALERRFKYELNHLKIGDKEVRLSDYVERYISTGGAEAVPDDVQAAAAFARMAYNTLKDALPAVPQDWADDKYWRAA